jgi:hypothetical protein
MTLIDDYSFSGIFFDKQISSFYYWEFFKRKEDEVSFPEDIYALMRCLNSINYLSMMM